MADTQRTLPEILALFADGAQTISAQDLRDAMVSSFIYGMIYIQDETPTAQTGIGGTPVLMTGFGDDGANGPASGITVDYVNGKMTVPLDGVYLMGFSLSFYGTNSTVFHVQIAVDSVSDGIGIERKLGTGGDVGVVASFGMAVLTAGQEVSLYVHGDGSSDQISVPHAQFCILKVG
jgi:hypothetical protein